MWTFGSSPKESSQPQNIFVLVESWTWISSPITASSSAIRATPSGRASKPIACSSAKAASSRLCSAKAGAAIWKPTGSCGPPPSGSARPAGIEIAGIPASGIGTVKKSFMYIASGSSVFSPSSKATEGEVGVTTKSKSAKAAAKSSAILVRTFWARP